MRRSCTPLMCTHWLPCTMLMSQWPFDGARAQSVDGARALYFLTPSSHIPAIISKVH